MALKPGTVANFQDSMAAAIEQSFKDEWDVVKDYPLHLAGEEDRKILFAAIAQGVVQHLVEHVGEAFIIDVRVTQTNEVLMQSDNPNVIPTTTPYTKVQQGKADVEQLEQEDNMVVSEGTATIVEVRTE